MKVVCKSTGKKEIMNVKDQSLVTVFKERQRKPKYKRSQHFDVNVYKRCDFQSFTTNGGQSIPTHVVNSSHSGLKR